MQHMPDLRILFPTSFSDSCFRTARAIAQLADTCRVGLTIAHVAKRGACNASIRRELDSFMGEADHYDNCRRVLMESDDAIGSIAELCESDQFDLIVAPASDRLGVHSLFSSSFRTRLLSRCKAPLWTIGGCLDSIDFKSSIRTVACLVDFDSDTRTYLPLAAAFAARLGAQLRIVSVLPEVSESTLAQSLNSSAPLMPDVAVEKIRSGFTGQACPEVDIAIGDVSRELPRLLRGCHADLAFVGPGQITRATWLPGRARYLDRLPCPAVCVDGASAGFSQWTFQNGAVREETRVLVPARKYAATASYTGNRAGACSTAAMS